MSFNVQFSSMWLFFVRVFVDLYYTSHTQSSLKYSYNDDDGFLYDCLMVNL